jgi:membrane-bound metal-dependent hydrolase YbcI (DUF457 family)
MADFKAHLIGGAAWGAVAAGVGLLTTMLTAVQAGAVLIVGTVAGLLPDLDSDTSKPLTFLFQGLALLVPMLLLWPRVRYPQYPLEWIVCAYTIAYLSVNYGLRALCKKMTVHRGAMHSLPFCFVCGGIGYMLFLPSGAWLAFYVAGTISGGCLLHLMQDEYCAVSWRFGCVPIIKKSRGSALKWVSGSLWGNLVVYFLCLIIFAGIVLSLH